MRDFERLRKQLRVAVFGLAAVSSTACGGSGKGASGPTVAAAPDAGGSGGDGRAGVMSTPAQNCTQGQWCGPSDKPRRFAASGGAERLGCPPDAADPDGTMFTLNDGDTAKARESGQDDACCYDFIATCYDNHVIEGRALVGGTVLRNGVSRQDDSGIRSPAWLRAAIAEYESVASFARATLELMAVGAPAALLQDVQRAALDEVRHAESAFALAGVPWPREGLPAVAPRRLDLAGVAVTTFAEGCVAETVALLRAERQLAGAVEAREIAHLTMIVRDETRHAALAWRTVAWCVAEGGDDVKRALRAAATQMTPPATVSQVGGDAWHGVIAPMLADVLG